MFSKHKKLIKNKTGRQTIKIGVTFTLIIFFIVCSCGCINQQQNKIKVSGAFALYPLMTDWADEYRKIHPDIIIEVSGGGAGKGMSDALAKIVDIGMVSRDIYQEEIEQGAFWISVAKDAVVATINTKNPAVSHILSNGLTREQFEEVFILRNITTWGQLVNDSSITATIRVYGRSDSCGAADTWAKYLGEYSQDDLTNVADSTINGDPNLAAAVQGDKQGIGFNNINYVYDSTTKEPYDNLIPVPIDLNGNGILEENEQFYDILKDIVDAIANNVYPSPPARALHLVTKTNFDDNEVAKNFVNWILTDGQQYVTKSGYIQLSSETIQDQLDYLENGSRN